MTARPITDRAARAARLTVESLGATRFRVSGGKEPHLVDLAVLSGMLCDCKDYRWNPGVDCKHLLAVRAHVPTNGRPAPARVVAPSASPTMSASARTPRFHLYTVDELLMLPPPTWLLAHHIPENSLVVLYGPPGAGKSFLALAWGMAIATGMPWLGCETKRGTVIYVAAEGGSGLGQRVQAYQNAHAIAGPVDLLFVRESVSLLEGGDVGALLADVDAWIDAHGTPARGIPEWPGLFIVDTMARCMAGGDENGAQDVGRVIAATDRIRHSTGAPVLLVHHTGKDGLQERGSSALRGAADAMFSLKNDEGTLTLECTKQKDAPAIEPRRLKLVALGDSCTIEPVEGHEPAAMTANGWKALRALLESFQGGESTVGVWQRVSGIPEASFYRTLKHLLELGYVSKRGARYVVSVAGETALRGTLIPLSAHSHESSPTTLSHSGGPSKAPGERRGDPGSSGEQQLGKTAVDATPGDDQRAMRTAT